MDHLVVVQCRFNSTRLPGKACYPFHTTSILGFLLNRLSCLPNNYYIVLATSSNSDDDIIANWGYSSGVDVFRGEESNVLSRYLECQALYKCETITRVTADNPFTCPKFLVSSVDTLVEKQLDYLYYMNLPTGMASDTFNATTLTELAHKSLNLAEKEHINGYILHNLKRYNVLLQYPEKTYSKSHRLTIDTIDDWKTLSSLVLPKLWDTSINEILSAMDSTKLD